MTFNTKTMKVIGGVVVLGLVLIVSWLLFYNINFYNVEEITNMKKIPTNQVEIILPPPQLISETSIEEAIAKRRSVRSYRDEPLNLREISQILWAAQGITAPEFGGRTAPSAGALFPLEVYLAVRTAEGIQPGVYRYLPENHSLIMILEGDVSSQLARAALGQMFIAEAPVALVFSGVFERTTVRYEERGIRYVYMEVGHAAQNVHLQAESLGLGTVVIGAFVDEEVKRILNMPDEESPLYIMPVGRK